VVVVEAAKRSGSLITARLALEQDRDVFAVPGSPLDPRAEGGNHLIQQGARLVTSAEDIIETLSQADPARGKLFEPDWEPAPGESFADTEPTTTDRAKLIEALSPTPVQVDMLIATTGLAVSIVQTLLLELDLAGRIEWASGQLVALKS
jgi:DNA processing protein